MKVLLITGDHSRHLYVQEAVLEAGCDCAAVIMEREELLPSPPSYAADHDKINFNRHFSDRHEVEATMFGNINSNILFADIPSFFCTPNTLNSEYTAKFVSEFAPELVFIFGPDLIKGALLSVLPEDRVNLHLGLSPWYRGSATLFWPFYFLQPQFAGATFHQIVPEADAGGVLHQCVPKLEVGDGIHDVAAKVVLQAKKDLKKLISEYVSGKKWIYKKQNSTGKLFLSKDFEPSHLRVIYDTFNNEIVDSYLNGKLGVRKPSLVSYF